MSPSAIVPASALRARTEVAGSDDRGEEMTAIPRSELISTPIRLIAVYSLKSHPNVVSPQLRPCLRGGETPE